MNLKKQSQLLSAMLIGFVGIAIVSRLCFAYFFTGKVWIDEIWVVANPASLLFQGWGYIERLDWDLQIRSLVPPVFVAMGHSALRLLGISAGTVALPFSRITWGIFNIAAVIVCASRLAPFYQLKTFPWWAIALVLGAPEVIHHSVSLDLSTMALPWLLFSIAPSEKYSLLQATSFVFSICLRIQMIPVYILHLLNSLFKSRSNKMHQGYDLSTIALATTLVLCLFLFVDTLCYGRWSLAPLQYFLFNLLTNKPSSYGITPFYFAFELMWKFTTEPVFFLGILLMPFSFKKAPLFTLQTLLLFLAHAAIPHKEFRFFHIPAVLWCLMCGLSWQSYLETNQSKKWAQGLAYVFLFLFAFVSTWRAQSKVAWEEFEMPLRLETIAGAQKDITGLLVFGYSGIRSGGHLSFYRALPHLFAPTEGELVRKISLEAQKTDLFNYVITPKNFIPADIQTKRDGTAVPFKTSSLLKQFHCQQVQTEYSHTNLDGILWKCESITAIR